MGGGVDGKEDQCLSQQPPPTRTHLSGDVSQSEIKPPCIKYIIQSKNFSKKVTYVLPT